jgi:hypothetical protein
VDSTLLLLFTLLFVLAVEEGRFRSVKGFLNKALSSSLFVPVLVAKEVGAIELTGPTESLLTMEDGAMFWLPHDGPIVVLLSKRGAVVSTDEGSVAGM